MSWRRRQPKVVLAVLLVVVLSLLGVDLATGPGGFAESVRGFAAGAFGPAQRATAAVGRSLADAGRGLTGSSRRELDRLRRENDAMRLRDAAAVDDRRRIADYDALLKTAGLGQYRIVPARVVAASGQQDPQRLVTIDAGTQDGIKSDMTVLSGSGLVGRVLRTGPTTCDVLLITDPGFSVGVRLENTGLIGVVTGNGADPLELRLLDSQTRVDPGTRLVTLGSTNGRPFVPGVPVGRVQSVQTKPGTLSRAGSLSAFVDPARLDLLGVVVQAPRTDPRDGVLPPKPAASPRPRASASPARAATPQPSP
ncbi:MAG: rod shape-determining protein MreC [Angustibacter sp.]